MLEQNYPNLEYIIIDGGSTDQTIEIIQKYEKHLHYWVSETDQGQSHAINKGLKHCSGMWFNWLNSDDYLEKNALQAIAAASNQNPHAQIIAGFLRQFIHQTQKTIQTYRLKIHPNLYENIVNYHICQPATFYRTELVTGFGGINQQLHYTMDVDLWLKYLTSHGLDRIVLTDDLLAHFREHEESKTVGQLDSFYVDRRAIELSILKSIQAPKSLLKIAQQKTLNEKYNYNWQNHHINREQYLELWCLRQIRFGFKSLNLINRAILLFFYIKYRPLKQFNEYKILIGDYLFPKIASYIKSFKP